MDETIKLRCISAKAECEKHILRIQTALKRLSNLFPLTEESLKSLCDEDMAVLDQFLYRFTKLQDCLGLRLIPALYLLLESETAVRPFIDILNRLEKLGVLTSAEDWQYFRSLRNNLAHEYPERTADIIYAINSLYESWQRFSVLYGRLIDTAEKTIQKS